MRNRLFIIVVLFALNWSIGQNFTELAVYEFKTPESYTTEEANVLLCANYLLDNPSNPKELNRLISQQYILKWMMGTPDHLFNIGEKATKLTKNNNDLFSLLMAAMTKVVLDNKDKPLSDEELYKQSEVLLADYCANSNNNLKPSKALKKVIKRGQE